MIDAESSPTPPLIRASEWRFVLLIGVLALVIASIPYILGASKATEERIFGGFVYAVEDGYAYLAHMHEGASGAWLFTLPYTPEPHSPRFFYILHLLMGKLAAIIPGGDLTTNMVLVYHAARWAFGMGLLLTVYRFLAAFTERVRIRRIAWLMVTFGSGLGWLLVALGQPNWLGHLPLDFILPEGFTFLVLYGFPHIALGRTLLLWGMLFLLQAWGEVSPTSNAQRANQSHTSRFTFYILTGLAWFLMGLIVPFYVAVAWAVMGAAWLMWSLHEGHPMWREAWLSGIAVFITAPVVLYSAWVFTRDPVYGTWAAQNLILSPHPLHYLAAYGLPLTLAAFGVRDAWRSERPLWLALAWVAVVPLLVYLPFNLQRRLVEGVQVPLSLLAAMGFSSLKLQGSRRRLATGVLLIMLSLTNVMLVAGNSLALRGRPAPIYRDDGEVMALDWLAARVEPEDVVLAAYSTGNYLPARVHARVFVGHGPETIHADEKKALVAKFFDATTTNPWRQELLERYGVDYLFWGPAERAVGTFAPYAQPYLQPIYETAEYAIFEIQR